MVTLMGIVYFNDGNASNITCTKCFFKITINYSLFCFFLFHNKSDAVRLLNNLGFQFD